VAQSAHLSDSLCNKDMASLSFFVYSRATAHMFVVIEDAESVSVILRDVLREGHVVNRIYIFRMCKKHLNELSLGIQRDLGGASAAGVASSVEGDGWIITGISVSSYMRCDIVGVPIL